MKRTVEEIISYTLSAEEVQEAITEYVNGKRAECGTSAIINDEATFQWIGFNSEGKPIGVSIINKYKKKNETAPEG